MSFNRLANNALWNLAGQIAPIMVALVALPPLIRALGIDRYGFLSLAWVLVGYASLFDLGISRAMTRVVAQRVAEQDSAGARHVGGVATSFMLLFGIMSGLLLAACAGSIVDGWLKVPQSLRTEAINAIWLLAASLPLVLITSAYRGYIEAHQAFKALNLVRIVMGVFTYVGPLLAAWISPRLEVTVGVVIAMRAIAAWAHARVADLQCDFRYRFSMPDLATAKHLFALGGWMSVSNVIGPLMSYLDRLMLAGLVAVEMVAYYATPYDLISRTMVLPYAVMAVLFPMIAGIGDDAKRLRETYDATIRMLFVFMFPVTFVALALGGPFLRVWLGADFAQHGTPVLQLLSIGILANALAQAPATLIQARGRPMWMAILHAMELPFFLFAIWYFTHRWGIAGTALAWSLRTVFDCAILFTLAGNSLGEVRISYGRTLMSLGLAACLCGAAYQASTDVQALIICISGLLIFAIFAWWVVFNSTDRTRVLNFTKRFRKPVI